MAALDAADVAAQAVANGLVSACRPPPHALAHTIFDTPPNPFPPLAPFPLSLFPFGARCVLSSQASALRAA